MLTASQLKDLLRKEGLRLSKKLGQHYLVDERLGRQFVQRCGLSSKDTVIEIGAGLGALTELLSQQAGRIIAVEIDKRISALLAHRMALLPQVTVVHQDILQFPWQDHSGITVVGAIPYKLTSHILVMLCQFRQNIHQAWLIVQQEVAERLLAKPATKAYGRLSVLGQYCWHIRSVMSFPRHAFFPQPGVDSCALHLISHKMPLVVSDEEVFFSLVKAAFAQRRKTLANCLAGSQPSLKTRTQVESLLRELGCDPAIRGEALSLEQFAALAQKVQELRQNVE